MSEWQLVTFKCMKKLVDEFDEAWKRIGKYKSRTHALHTAMEFFIEENKEA